MRKHHKDTGLNKSVLAKMGRLATLLAEHDQQCWVVGDLVADIFQSHRVPLGVISQCVKYSKSRLSELSTTARAFPVEMRSNFQDCLTARRICRILPRLRMTVFEIRDEIAQMRGKRPAAVTAHFLRIMSEQLVAAAQVGPDPVIELLAEKCYCDDWREIIPKLPNKSVKIFNADPPYGSYGPRNAGGYLSGRAETNGLRLDADGNDNEAALEATLALFDLCLPKIMDSGCLLLWQAGARPDSRIILDKAADAGWDLPYALTWLKSPTAIADHDYPYAPTSERILVFIPRGTRLYKHENGLNCGDVLHFPSITAAAVKKIHAGLLPAGAVHMFQKPVELMSHLIRKHSFVGELVVDCFGCSGSACIAAHALGRRWIYIEKNRNNFEWGRQRIQEAVAGSSFDPLEEAAQLPPTIELEAVLQ